jgi:23S rRNA (cytidine1920-2'-O)/16S rRNA (cytidine1409-2'-O)-methyltransferase
MQKKKRLDVVLVEKGLAETQARAASLVMAGMVYAGTKRLDKPGMLLAEAADINVKNAKTHQWVSRGGIKLAHGLAHFALDPKGKTAIDVGSSTGGFTDVLLHHGARKVYAVDVGYGELDWRLRQDERVVVLERVNARFLEHSHIPEAVDMIVCDASFIGLETVLATPLTFAAVGAVLVALIKPQFEVSREAVGNGIITDPALHKEVCERIEAFIARLPGWEVMGITPSPIKGMEGNTEFLIAARKE